TAYAPSFPRLPSRGLRISVPGNQSLASQLESSTLWQTAIDTSVELRVDQPEDHFLHIYEKRSGGASPLTWVPAKLLEFKNSTGNSPPWHLSPRMLPQFRIQKTHIAAIHNVKSMLSAGKWTSHLVGHVDATENRQGLLLPAGSRHSADLELPQHVTAFIRFFFKRPNTAGGILKVIYSESYEDEPVSTPWHRKKDNRCDYSKSLIGPQDIYEFRGKNSELLNYYSDETSSEVFMPFHFRTFRFMKLEIDAGSSDLLLDRLEIDMVNYPLDLSATFDVSTGDAEADHLWDQLWSTSIRTLENCMHDCYEDCPFYEQLQYAMDTRSSSLFTYNVSGDDRLARQAMIQIRNSFQSRVGLTASRAPTHRVQLIPHFSLYWISMVHDHFIYHGDQKFVSTFLPVIDAVLAYFEARVGEQGLVCSDNEHGIWQFVDWTHQWKPHGIPPALQRTGISTFTNQLYAYALHNAASLVGALGRPAIADEYIRRADCITQSLKTHCFDGELFTDTLVSQSDSSDYSQHCQVWAVLSGCVAGVEAQSLLRESLRRASTGEIVRESISMSFYTMRALSLAGGDVYDTSFHQFWDPWRAQLSQNVTTWVEDHVSQRSDCHAWGSIPVYEFMVEVAGVRPTEPGWTAMEFRPRIGLFPKVRATVPLNMVNGKPRGLVHVAWSRRGTGEIDVVLGLDIVGPEEVSVSVVLPQHQELIKGKSGQWKFVIGN
ncbi:hypothetical protein QQX98_013205, partial [Neonectria punicea]